MRFGLEENIIEKITHVLEEQPKVNRAYFFGSRAKGNYRPDSDIDIAVKGFDLTVEDMLKMSAAIDKAGIGYEVDLVDYNGIKEEALKEHINRVGNEFYNSWTEYKLEDVCSKIGSGATPRGGGNVYKLEGISLIRSQNVLDLSFSYDGLAFIDEDQANELQSVTVKENDILLNITGDSVARVCKVPKEVLPARVNQHVAIIRSNNQCVNCDYLLYYLFSIKEHLLSLSEIGGTRNALTKGMLEDLNIPLPNVHNQVLISEALKNLDNQINLLHRQNKTLESIAEALFRYWFMEEGSEELVNLGDFAYNIREHVRARDLNLHEHYIGLEHIQKKAFTLTAWGNVEDLESDKLIFKENDILFGKLRPYFHKVVFAPINGVCSTDILVIRPKNRQWFLFCLLWFFSKEVVDYSDLASEGTRMPRTNWEILSSYKIPKPSLEKIEEFEKRIGPNINKIKVNIKRIRLLTSLRDTLLPKLFSSEARVKLS